LGVFEDAVYEEHHRDLAPGHIIAIGTDGIWEARNSEGRMFGKAQLQAHLYAATPNRPVRPRSWQRCWRP